MDQVKLSLHQDDKEALLEALQGLPHVPDTVQALKKEGVYLVVEVCKRGYADILQYLIAEDVDITDTGGQESAMQVACRYNQVPIVELLLLRGAPILPDKVLAWHQASPLYIASMLGHVDVIQKIVSHNPGLVKDEDIRSCLFYAACCGGQIDTMKLWITPSMNINHPLKMVEIADFSDCEKLTPLYAACANGHKHVIKFLIEACLSLEFPAIVCNAYPDIIGEFFQCFFVPMDTSNNKDSNQDHQGQELDEMDELFQLMGGQLQDKQLSVLHASWLLPYAITLVELNISDNKLTELPSCLPWKFQNLRTLSAMRNQIRCIMPPSELDEEDVCPSLEEMNLSYNNLDSVCQEVFQISTLKSLNLSHNKLQLLVRPIHMQADRSVDLVPEHRLALTDRARRDSSMPKAWHLSFLSSLDVSHNSLQMLPAEIIGCVALVRLDASHNHLSTFPQPWDCPLAYLDLSHNQLEQFPVNVEQYWCGSLRYLNISNNQLDEIKEGIVKLNVLTDLNASYNKIERLPATHLWECSHLHQLDLKHNRLGVPLETTPTKFRTIPVFMRKKSQGSVLKESNQGPEFPELLNSCLRELRLADNNLDCVPLSVCDMTMLEVLDISQNPLIKSLPKEIGKLKNCGMLKLKGLALDNVPPEILGGKPNNTKQILNGFLESLRSCKPYRKIKTLVIGKKDKGKTTLVSLLSEKKGTATIEQKSIVCQEILLHRRKVSFPLTKAYDVVTDLFTGDKRPDIKLKVWDIAGDEAYNLIQHSVYTPNTLYILVWDFWSIGDELDKIGQFLYNIQASTSHFSVVIVGTFLDKVNLKSGEKEDALSKLEKKMAKKLSNLPQLPPVCPVSCASNEGMDTLKAVLYEQACKMKWSGKRGQLLIDRKVPQSYLHLEARLADHLKQLQGSNRPLCLTQKELSELMEEEKDFAELLQPEEYTTVTKFLVESGSLLHFSDQLGALNTLYFLDPAWLCDSLVHTLTSPRGKELLKRGSGKISRSEVKSLYMEDPRFPDEFIDQYIELLERFEIAVSITQSTQLFFPSQLPEKPPLMSEESVDITKKLCRLYRMAECPSSFWTHLLTRMMSRVEQISTTQWFHTPHMTSSIRILSRRGPHHEVKRSSSCRGLQIKNTRKTYCKEWIQIYHSQGSFKVEPVTFTGEESKDRLSKGVLITEVDHTEKFGIIGIIVDEIEDIIQDYYPGLLEPDEMTMLPRLERYAVCSTCFSDVDAMYTQDINHFSMEHCARLLVHDSMVRCPQGIKHDLDKLVPDFLMKELPSRFIMNRDLLELVENEDNFLGGGVTGSVFKAKYNGRSIAVKVYRSDIRNVREDFTRTLPGGQSSDSGTATMSTQGSTTGILDVEVEEDDETEYINFARDKRIMLDMNEVESLKAFKALREMRQEVTLTSRLQHPCIVSLLGISFSPKLMMALELAPCGSLRDVLDRHSANRPVFNKYRDKDKIFPPLFGKALTFKFAYQIARGLKYLHDSGIIYKDLKSDNILTMSEDLRAPVNLKLSDYGISKYCWSGRSFGLVGTPGYQAPEILDSLAYDEKVDIFSFGMVIYEILTGRRPFMEYENLAQITRAIKTEDKRPRVEDFNVKTQFPYLEDVMKQCWRSHASERPRAADIVSKRSMQNVHFLSQSTAFEIVDRELFTVDCVMGGNEKKSLLWIWDGKGTSRTCSVLDLEKSCPRVFRKEFAGSRVLCMACVGRYVWIGTEHQEIEVYGSETSGRLKRLSNFGLDAEPVEIQVVLSAQSDTTSVYVALKNANLLQFKNQEVRHREPLRQKSVKKMEGFKDHKTVVLRSDKILCMTIANQQRDLWVSNTGHVDIIDCSDFKVVKAERINLELLCGMLRVRRHSDIIQMAGTHDQVFCLFKNSQIVLVFGAVGYTCTGIMRFDEHPAYNKVVWKPVQLTQEDHVAYHGIDSEFKRLRNESTSSSESGDSAGEETDDAPDIPPTVPPRPYSSYSPQVPPKEYKSKSLQRPPAIPKRSTLINPDYAPEKSKLHHAPSQSLPYITQSSRNDLIVTSIASVRDALWVGRSTGDICIVDVSKTQAASGTQNEIKSDNSHQSMQGTMAQDEEEETEKYGKVVASLYDMKHRNRGNSGCNIELFTVGKYVASAYKLTENDKVELASWDAYNASDVKTVECYWKDLLNIEKNLIEKST